MYASTDGSVEGTDVLGLLFLLHRVSMMLVLKFMRVHVGFTRVSQHILIFLLCAAAVNCSVCDAEKQPNVLVFLMDDMGYGDIRALNPAGAGFETPHLDNLLQLISQILNWQILIHQLLLYHLLLFFLPVQLLVLVL